MKTTVVSVFAAGALVAAGAAAQDYPSMVGTWVGKVRTVSSGTSLSGEIAKGGALIAEASLKVVVNHQDGEVFTGVSHNAEAGTETPVWGAIRSTGTEGIFVSLNGGRGSFWFAGPTRFEFCFGNNTEEILSAYCGQLTKE